MILGNVNLGNEALDGGGAVGDGTIAEELVHDFTTAHANVFVGLEGITNVDLDVAGGDEFHATNLEKDEKQRSSSRFCGKGEERIQDSVSEAVLCDEINIEVK